MKRNFGLRAKNRSEWMAGRTSKMKSDFHYAVKHFLYIMILISVVVIVGLVIIYVLQ